MDQAALEANLERFASNHRLFRQIVRSEVVGYDNVVTDLLTALLAKGHCLLEGVPGLAKTTLARNFAATVSLDFRRLQFTQDLLPADITGHGYYDSQRGEFDIRKGPVFTNLLLADELNRAPPKVQSALLESMEEGQVSIEGQTFRLPDPFFVVATMNPIDVEGTYSLPEALMDRFMLRTKMAYIPQDQELELLDRMGKPETGGVERKILKRDAITIGQQLAPLVEVPPQVTRIIQRIALNTRSHPDVALGASTRAMVQFIRAAKAYALLRGRAQVEANDMAYLAPRVLEHRILLKVKSEMRGRTAEDVIEEALESVPKTI